MTPAERDAKFADLAMLVLRAEERYKSNPTKINKERWLKLSREYSRQLQERQNEKSEIDTYRRTVNAIADTYRKGGNDGN